MSVKVTLIQDKYRIKVTHDDGGGVVTWLAADELNALALPSPAVQRLMEAAKPFAKLADPNDPFWDETFEEIERKAAALAAALSALEPQS